MDGNTVSSERERLLYLSSLNHISGHSSVSIEISPMEAADIPAILDIERDSQPEPWSEELFREEMHRPYSKILVARIPERFDSPLGYICFWEIADEIQVLDIAVHRAHRRRGIGRALLRWTLHHGLESGARIAVLEVRISNLGAQKFYKSFGFRAVGERPNYYALNETAVIMELQLECLRREMNESFGRV